MKDPLQLLEKFRARFGMPAALYRAPGRVNLIGEHTDYNDGFVLPAAIEFYCWVAAAPRSDRKLVVRSENFDETVESNLDSISPAGKSHWSSYPIGVAWAIEGAGKGLQGANLLISGNVPLGAGLSSSAAIEVATGFALLHQSGVAIDLNELAKWSQKGENEFVGAHVGIMDQFVACHGLRAHALLLDCRSLEFQLVQLPVGIQLVICNTMVKHEIASGEYNRRRAECEEGVRVLRTVLPEIRALRDVTLAQLETHRALLDPIVYSRCRHVVSENDRTQEAIRALNTKSLSVLGGLMRESHRSLRDDYEVSCKELDLMVEIATAQPGVIGARMTGGGFGGCTINLVESAAVDAFKQSVAAKYHAATGLIPEIYVSPAADGVQQIDLNAEKLVSTPHKRFNPLLREWVLVSPQRTERPWQGKVETLPAGPSVTYDPNCYLCPGNKRAGGNQTPKYSATYVFDNDFPALLPDGEPLHFDAKSLLKARTDRGICRVLCFSPRHDLTIPRMNSQELRGVVDAWIEQYSELAKIPWVRHVQIFENRGVLMGASNPHPHCQIWANATLPNLPAREDESLNAYHAEKHSCLLCDYLQLELQRNERVVCHNDAFAVLVPFWAVWPFETLVLSKRHLASIDQLNSDERELLGDILRRISIRYDNLFETAFPYSMGFHQRPTDGQAHEAWHLHAHYLPPLLRSATVRKFMVGYELLASPQRDLSPESAASRLREVRESHYLDRPGNTNEP